ncbi:MAG: heat-shock protein [Mariprofundales bacterium]
MLDTLLLLLLALAISALCGWLLWYLRQEQDSVTTLVQQDARLKPLLRGINYLLADEPDEAMRELVNIARLHTETAEVYLALGGLFRKRGEVGRAVRIHQNLLARPELPEHLRIQAHMALGNDFQSGGFLERALRQYAKVLEVDWQHIGALQAQLRIYEQEHDWHNAENSLRIINQVTKQDASLHLAYLRAEQGNICLQSGDVTKAEQLADAALTMHQACASAHLLRITILLLTSKEDEAKQAIINFTEQNSHYISMLAEIIATSPILLHQLFDDWVIPRWQKQQDAELVLTWLESMNACGDNAIKQAALVNFRPRYLRDTLRLQAMMPDTIDSPEDNLHLQHARQWRMSVRNFVCEKCGVQVIAMRWQCPQCHRWGSLQYIGNNI